MTPRPTVARRRRPIRWLALALLVLPAAPAVAEIEPALNAEVGGPQELSANLGIRIASGSANARGYGRGFVLQAQPGIGGGALNVGWMPISFAAHGTQAIGVGVKARLLRTWGTPWGADPDRTYAGVEAAAVIGVKASVGVLWRISGESGRRTVVTWGVGIGF